MLLCTPMTLNEKIAVYRQKLAQLSPETAMYSNYKLMITELEKENAKPAVKLHKDVGDVCESCT
jgi:hypothetical protein